jgi:hypothetical protein
MKACLLLSKLLQHKISPARAKLGVQPKHEWGSMLEVEDVRFLGSDFSISDFSFFLTSSVLCVLLVPDLATESGSPKGISHRPVFLTSWALPISAFSLSEFQLSPLSAIGPMPPIGPMATVGDSPKVMPPFSYPFSALNVGCSAVDAINLTKPVPPDFCFPLSIFNFSPFSLLRSPRARASPA